MNGTSNMNLSLSINQVTTELLRVVSSVCEELGVAWVIVGATARDLVLHHGYGALVRRATQDIDFAIEVADWESFQKIKEQLLLRGFTESRLQHRLLGPNGEPIDLIPFGQIEDKDNTIAWPPKGDVAMNVSGFPEACGHADNVIIEGHPNFTVPVATPVGMALLKLIAWTDRAPDMRRKDAADIKYIFENYERIPSVRDEAYNEASAGVMESYDWDLTLACCHLLGRHAREIASNGTVRLLSALIAGEVNQRRRAALIIEMSENQLEDERNTQLFRAFSEGFEKLLRTI